MTEPSTNNEILNAFIKVLPYLSVFFDNEASIAVTTANEYIVNQTSPALKLSSVPGDPIPEGGAAAKAIKTGKAIVNNVPKEVYGTPFRSYAVPIKDACGNVAGCVMLGKSLVKHNELLDLSRELSLALNRISQVTDEFSTKMKTVVDLNQETFQKVEQVNNYAKSAEDIMKQIDQLSMQTDLLGINASIEAARAGEKYKGFSVIAQEIHKLSDSTGQSIDKINAFLTSIEESVKLISSMTYETQEIIQKHAASFNEIATTVSTLSQDSKMLESMADRI